jgi:hypothetical protein
MTDFDPDRIAALAAGSLDPAEAAALERRITADPRAAAELAAQRLALQALHQAPAPVLSAEERSELHRAVAASLNLGEAAPAVLSTRRRVPWRPIAVAAAALAAIAAAVPLVGLLSVGEDQSALSTVAEANFTARSTADGGEDLASSEETAAGAAILGAQAAPEAATEAARAIQEFLHDPASLIAAADADLSTCRTEAADLLGAGALPPGGGALISRETGEVVVWFLSADGATVQSLAVFDPRDCSLLASHP